MTEDVVDLVVCDWDVVFHPHHAIVTSQHDNFTMFLAHSCVMGYFQQDRRVELGPR